MMEPAAVDPQLLERLKIILRRDLKLGADAPIAGDMSFFNSDIDLDSLDMLLLVTSVEKEFGVKIPNEAVGSVTGKEAFFAGHFPGKPLVPGVLIAEALAQISGLAGAGTGVPEAGKLAHVDVRFDEAVVPPVEIVLKSRLTRSMPPLQL